MKFNLKENYKTCIKFFALTLLGLSLLAGIICIEVLLFNILNIVFYFEVLAFLVKIHLTQIFRLLLFYTIF